MSKKGIFWSIVGVLLALMLIAGGLVYFVPSWREKALGLFHRDNTKVEEPTKPNNEILELQNKLQELNSKLEDLDNKKLALENEIKALNLEHKTSIDNLQNSLSVKESELLNAQNRLEELQNDINASTDEIERLQGEITTITSEKQGLENQILELNLEHEEEISGLNNQIEDLTIEKTNLQKQFNDYKLAVKVQDYSSNSYMFFNQNFITSYDLSSIGVINSSEVYNSFNFSSVTN